MKVTANQAFELSKSFRDLSVEVGNYRFKKWKKLTPSQRRDLEDLEWSLLNSASDMTTKAVGLVLDQSEISFKSLQGSVTKAKKAIKRLNLVKKVLKVATTAVGLATAVISKDLGAIAKNAKSVFDAATEKSTKIST